MKNPTVIFEILSVSEDLGRKLFYYMQLESLKQYVIIDSNKMHVRVITKRGEERTWRFDVFDNLEDKILIEPINFKIPVAALYERVKI